MKKGIVLILFWLMPIFLPAAEFPPPQYKSIAPGVWFGSIKKEDPPIIYHVIKVDPGNEQIVIRPIRPEPNETLGQLAVRIDSEKVTLLGAITADYYQFLKEYNLIIPWGILLEDGKLIFSPSGKSALCFAPDSDINISVPTLNAHASNHMESQGVPVTAVNRYIEFAETDCCIYNSTWGTYAPEFPKGYAITVTGDSVFRVNREIKGTVSGISRLPVRAPIPSDGFIMIMKELPSPDRMELRLGSPILVNLDISSSLENAIGGGPRILRDGKISIEISRENFGAGIAFYIKNSRHPRSAVGIDSKSGLLFLVIVEGRSDESKGMNMKELARLLMNLGATDGMAFDGGRSVSMYAGGREIIRGDRPMADALGVFQLIK